MTTDLAQRPLKAFRISNGALASDALPARLKILSFGENPSTKGRVFVGSQTATVLPENQRMLGFDRVALDFEHNTVPGTPAYKESKEPRPVAAYGVPSVVPGDGVYLESLEWTPEGKANAKNYVDLSPAVKQDDKGEVLFLHSVALTRNGSVFDLSFYNVENKDKTSMEETISVAELAKALGLPDTATKADVLAKLKGQSDAAEKVEALSALIKDGKIVALGAIESDVKALKTAIAGLQPGGKVEVFSATVDGKTVALKPEELVSKVLSIESRLESSANAATEQRRVELINKFSADGKVPVKADGKAYSADELKTLSVDVLQILHANTPVTVPMNARGRQPAGGGAGDLKGVARVGAAWAHLQK